MSDLIKLREKFGDIVSTIDTSDMPTILVDVTMIQDVCFYLRDKCAYEQLIDLCGVDRSEYPDHTGDRFEIVYHLLSLERNERLRIKVAIADRQMLSSVIDVWPAANWYEREAFDMYGIIFNDHPDLRRILTDYGFEGHPLRKDFPLTGRVEMFFDEEQWRCVYKPNKLKNRVLIPKTWPGADRG